MGYWDKKAEQEVEEREKPDITLEEYEQASIEKLESDGAYLSRKMKEHQDRFATVTSDGFYFCVYFNNDTQKEEFLKAMGFDKDSRYIKGKEFVKRFRKNITSEDFDFGKEKLPVKEFKERARPIYKLQYGDE